VSAESSVRRRSDNELLLSLSPGPPSFPALRERRCRFAQPVDHRGRTRRVRLPPSPGGTRQSGCAAEPD
jgi:hypothetical protein